MQPPVWKTTTGGWVHLSELSGRKKKRERERDRLKILL